MNLLWFQTQNKKDWNTFYDNNTSLYRSQWGAQASPSIRKVWALINKLAYGGFQIPIFGYQASSRFFLHRSSEVSKYNQESTNNFEKTTLVLRRMFQKNVNLYRTTSTILSYTIHEKHFIKSDSVLNPFTVTRNINLCKWKLFIFNTCKSAWKCIFLRKTLWKLVRNRRRQFPEMFSV